VSVETGPKCGDDMRAKIPSVSGPCCPETGQSVDLSPLSGNCCGEVQPRKETICSGTGPAQEGADCCSAEESAPVLPQRPGYDICAYVEGVVATPVGSVPRIATRLTRGDHLGGFRVRWGLRRSQYRVTPGLYAVGAPGPDDPVLVTANYKLSFDALRRELGGRNLWILVLDTRGVNVWCAAGKGTFGTEELIRRVQFTGLERIVNHRKLVLPQLGAVGVAAHAVKQGCGFRVVWGPIRAADLPACLDQGLRVDPAMRRVTFTLWERTVLIPVELSHLAVICRWLLPLLFILSGIGAGVFSLGAAWFRGVPAAGAFIMAVLGGAVLGPLLLPWLPGRAFAVKGALTGLVAALGCAALFRDRLGGLEIMAILFFTTAASSYLTMNYTGTTPFTSPSGVEKEMRIAIPAQIGGVVLSGLAWVAAPFLS